MAANMMLAFYCSDDNPAPNHHQCREDKIYHSSIKEHVKDVKNSISEDVYCDICACNCVCHGLT